jgi:hypothetical protein
MVTKTNKHLRKPGSSNRGPLRFLSAQRATNCSSTFDYPYFFRKTFETKKSLRAPGLEPGTFALSAQRATNCATPAMRRKMRFSIHKTIGAVLQSQPSRTHSPSDSCSQVRRRRRQQRWRRVGGGRECYRVHRVQAEISSILRHQVASLP